MGRALQGVRPFFIMAGIVTSDPDVLALDIENWTASQVKGMAASLAMDLYNSTPVDTGWARSNWVVSLNQPIDEVTDSKEAVSDARFFASLEFLQAWKPDQSPLLFITNNVPYIGMLNNGWSKQAPAGFIEAAVARAQAHAEWPIQG